MPSWSGLIMTVMTPNKFRTLALELPDTSESQHMGHPDFRCGDKIFATLGYPGADWAMVKLTPQQQRLFLKLAPEMFVPCRGIWGRKGATNVRLAAAKVRVIRSALRTAWKNVNEARDA